MQCTFFFHWSPVCPVHLQSSHISKSNTAKYLQMFVWWRWRRAGVDFSWMFLYSFPIVSCNCRRGGYVFPSSRLLVCWFVGLCAGWHKNYWTDFYKTWMEDGSRPRLDPNKFWCRSLNLFWLSLMLRHGAFFNISDNFSGMKILSVS